MNASSASPTAVLPAAAGRRGRLGRPVQAIFDRRRRRTSRRTDAHSRSRKSCSAASGRAACRSARRYRAAAARRRRRSARSAGVVSSGRRPLLGRRDRSTSAGRIGQAGRPSGSAPPRPGRSSPRALGSAPAPPHRSESAAARASSAACGGAARARHYSQHARAGCGPARRRRVPGRPRSTARVRTNELIVRVQRQEALEHRGQQVKPGALPGRAARTRASRRRRGRRRRIASPAPARCPGRAETPIKPSIAARVSAESRMS